MKNWWKYSSLRFYILNIIHNYKFWLNAKKLYDITKSSQKDRLGNTTTVSSKKRFKGYVYNGKIYLDNPGIPNIERGVWESWKAKGLIK